MEIRPGRTDAYFVSLNPACDKDMDFLKSIRTLIRNHNKANPNDKKRVTVKGREPLMKESVYNIGTRTWRMVGYSLFGDIVGNKYTNSKRLDIYLHSIYS